MPSEVIEECSFDYTYIYRSTSQSGNYTNIANQVISDNTYCDEDGSSISWYKIRFYNSSTTNWSAYSEPMQGGTFIGYCSMGDFRAVTNLTTSCLSDADAYDLITLATYQINGDINTKAIRERIEYINSTRQNKIDGVNKTFYIKNWEGKYLADLNNDSEVTTNDLIVYSVEGDGTETTLTISSIDVDEGKFVLSEAPNNVTLYVTYSWSYIDESIPAKPLRLACAFLTAALAQAKINIGRAPRVSMGNITLYRHMDAYNEYYQKYLGILRQINDRISETIDVSGIKG